MGDNPPVPPPSLFFPPLAPGTPHPGEAPTPTQARGAGLCGRLAHCLAVTGTAAAQEIRGPQTIRGGGRWEEAGRRRPGLLPRRGGTMGPHPGEGGREGGGVRSARGALAAAAAATAKLRLERAGRGAGVSAEEGGGGGGGACGGRAGGRAAGTGLVNKLRCCLGLAGLGAAAAAAAPERRFQAPAAARPSASAPALRALPASPQPPNRDPRGPAADLRGM